MNDSAVLKKALERLVSSLIDPEVKTNRIEMVEEALLAARMALGQDQLNDEQQDTFLEGLESLGVQLLIDSMARQELMLYRAKVTFSDDPTNPAVVVLTTHPILGPLLDKHVEQMVNHHHPDKPKRLFDVN